MSRQRLCLPSAQQSSLDHAACLAIAQRGFAEEDNSRPAKRLKTEFAEPGWAPVLELEVDCDFADTNHASLANVASVRTFPVSVTAGFEDPVLTISESTSDRPLFSFVCHEAATDSLHKLRWLQTLLDKDQSVSLCIRLVSSAVFQTRGAILERASVTIRSDIRFDQSLERVVKLSLKNRLALLDYVFPRPPVEVTADDFYNHIGTVPKDFLVDSEDRLLQHPAIACRLYPFQKRTVSWMLQREGAIPFRPKCVGDVQLEFAPLWEKSKDLDDNDLYVNRHQAFASTDLAWVNSTFKQPRIRGGILAEV